ncbi:hypothetical protein ARAM_003875 [Aspergillus rambellii]|uniref:Kinetochore complex Sim4 subunit Fta1-domain-containing protein n=1 Tax=Aspergillus rambellii TaxID=308745 RepID=A0A0F8U7X8_9EURO|nr:hypothetical protein ARAM_003875 [Aspergillus rambellii]
MAQTSPHHLLNTSWTSHRLSPLHHGNEFETLLDNPTALDTYATRLRDHLTNSLANVQGWQAEEDAPTLSTIGALKSCTWATLSPLSDLGGQTHQTQREDHQAGILVTLEYENITYKAALLAAPTTSASEPKTKKNKKSNQKKKVESNSTYLPVLLTRLPRSLRESFTGFLSATFDTYCSLLRLPSKFMCAALETYVGGLSSRAEGNPSSSSALIEDVIKEMHLTLSFSPPISPALKSLNLSIPQASLTAFVRAAPSPSTIGSASGSGSVDDQGSSSVLSGLSAYLEKHLALDSGMRMGMGSAGELFWGGEYVRLTRIACAGFVITGEGRVKLVAQARDGEGEEEEGRSERNRAALRASESLLRALLGRGVAEE